MAGGFEKAPAEGDTKKGGTARRSESRPVKRTRRGGALSDNRMKTGTECSGMEEKT